MKRLVLLCLASIIGAIAFAQQPIEWQPSIAEDNKAASLSDTTEFLLNAVRSNGGGGTVAYQNAAMSGSDTLELVLSDSTEAREHAHCCDGGEVILPIDDDRIALAKVDPLTITVTALPNNVRVNFRGHSESTVVQRVQAVYKIGGFHYQGGKYKVGFPCLDGVKKCEMLPPVSLTSYSITFRDIEVAKRFARGLLHAALLCGGTKAVSPF